MWSENAQASKIFVFGTGTRILQYPQKNRRLISGSDKSFLTPAQAKLFAALILNIRLAAHGDPLQIAIP
jgi:hypothetical protein